MSKWTELLGELSDAQVDQVFGVGTEQHLPAGTVLVEEGARVDAMYFLIQGLLEVRVRSLPGAPLAMLGAGEIVGDMSFLDQLPASATVVVAEDSHVLRLPQPELRLHMERHPEFAAHFYRVLGVVLSRRLRRTIGQLADQPRAFDGRAPLWKRANEATAAFTGQLIQVDKLAIKSKGSVSAKVFRELSNDFGAFTRLIGAIMSADGQDELVKAEIGRLVQHEMLPFLLMTQVAERMYSKPRGYAGDFYTIELIYKNEGGGSGRIGPLLDRCFLEDRAACAVRNRRVLMANEIRRTVLERNGGTAEVLSIACGPAREVFDVFETLADPQALHATLLDVDVEALEFVSQLQHQRGLDDRLTTARENPVFVALGRKKLAVPPLDLVYSIGMIDYLSDKLTVKIIDYAFDSLQPGGRVILGNFHPSNTSRALMDCVLEWQLIHRTEEDMNRLFRQSKFARPCSRITFEQEGIDLFAECIK